MNIFKLSNSDLEPRRTVICVEYSLEGSSSRGASEIAERGRRPLATTGEAYALT